MSNDLAWTAVVILGSMLAGWTLAGLVLWMVAEIDERKWRRRMRDIMSERVADRV